MKRIGICSIPLIVIVSLLFTLCAGAEEGPEFDDKTVIVVMKAVQNDEITLFSDPFEGLGIAEIKDLDADDDYGISLFSADSGERTLELTLEEAGGENVLRVVEALNEMSEVEYAQPNFYYYLEDTPNDGYYQWGYQYNLSKIGAEYVWDMDIDGSGMTVAVLDTGMMMTHEDLADNLWTNTGEIANNGKDDDGNGYIDDVHGWDFGDGDNSPDDCDGHGTHVSGIVSAVTGNGKGVASLARNVKIAPLKIYTDEGVSTSSALYAAFKYVKKMGFKVANCSWGSSSYDIMLRSNISKCTDTVIVAAAGNAKTGYSATNNDRYPVYPASYALSNIIAVASTDSSDNLSSFSNYGKSSVDIAAPGTAIYSTLYTGESSYGAKSGTSMAAPLVASAAALVRVQDSSLTAKQTINVILNNADAVSSLTGKVSGSRRLNAYKAIESVSPEPTPAPEPAEEPAAESVEPMEDTDKQLPFAKEAELKKEDGNMHLGVIFDENDYKDIKYSEVTAYIAYRREGLLVKVSTAGLKEDFTADIPIDEEYADCDIEAYLWSSNMQPLCGVLLPS